MKINTRAILFTIVLYAVAFLASYLTDRFYVSRGANDITGPPFMVMVLSVLVILFFFLRSVYIASAKDKSYWSVVLLHIVLLAIVYFNLFV